jgi:hypothetical protein
MRLQDRSKAEAAGSYCDICAFLALQPEEALKQETWVGWFAPTAGVQAPRLAAFAGHGDPEYVRWKLRDLLISYIEEHLLCHHDNRERGCGLTPRGLLLVQFEPIKRLAAHRTAADPAVYPFALASLGIIMGDFEMTSKSMEVHPTVATNIFRISSVSSLLPPLHLADQIAAIAQRYVGYWCGQEVIVETPMAVLESLDPNNPDNYQWRDPAVRWGDSVEFTMAPLPDDCVFCQRMTEPDTIYERVAEFQWELDKEAHRSMLQHLTTARACTAEQLAALTKLSPATKSGSRKARLEYHEQLDKLAPEGVWRPVPLVRMPYELQRGMVVEWNHAWLDWIESDARFCFINGEYYTIWTERVGGELKFDEPTRSMRYEATAFPYTTRWWQEQSQQGQSRPPDPWSIWG